MKLQFRRPHTKGFLIAHFSRQQHRWHCKTERQSRFPFRHLVKDRAGVEVEVEAVEARHGLPFGVEEAGTENRTIFQQKYPPNERCTGQGKAEQGKTRQCAAQAGYCGDLCIWVLGHSGILVFEMRNFKTDYFRSYTYLWTRRRLAFSRKDQQALFNLDFQMALL